MHRALEISEANVNYGIFRELLARFQKTYPVRSRYLNRAVTLIEQSPQNKLYIL